MHTKTTIGWLRIETRNHLLTEWKNLTPNPPIPISKNTIPQLSRIPRYQASNIFRVARRTTEDYENYHNVNPICGCGLRNSSTHTFLLCQLWTTERLKLADSGPFTLDHLLQIKLIQLNKFIMMTGMVPKTRTRNFRGCISNQIGNVDGGSFSLLLYMQQRLDFRRSITRNGVMPRFRLSFLCYNFLMHTCILSNRRELERGR